MNGMRNRTKSFLLEELTTFTLNHSISSQGWVSLYTKKDTPKGSDISPRVRRNLWWWIWGNLNVFYQCGIVGCGIYKSFIEIYLSDQVSKKTLD